MSSEKPLIKVLIVDDSPVSRQLLSYILQSDPGIQVLAGVGDGIEAIKFLGNHTPDVILMDINMPKMNGFEATRHIMSQTPIPIIICSGEYKSHDINLSFQAIEAGALAILEKPKGLNDPSFDQTMKVYVETIKMVAEVKLVTRQVSQPLRKSSLFATTHEQISNAKLQKAEAIAIGASLGGPQALLEIFTKLKKPFPLPIFVVQHITSGFTEGFVSWLNSETSCSIKLAEHMEKALPGTVYVAPSEKQMEIRPGNIIHLVNNLEKSLLNPSISHLFKSMAETYKERGVGIILTGMGRDGVQELLLMKNKGALTLAQSKEKCLMYGMPREAANLGAASQIIHLDDIAPFLNQIKTNG